jgi:hypothetical protein
MRNLRHNGAEDLGDSDRLSNGHGQFIAVHPEPSSAETAPVTASLTGRWSS